MPVSEISLPCLSEYDPVDAAEGSIDPLGLYPIADGLATLLAPGVRERQQHPRFLTTLAVSHEVCSIYDEDDIAADGVTEPWLVFEWYLVEGLVRSEGEDRLYGLPGRDKAQAAIRDRVPLSHTRYLKSAANFGFHAVYRRLATAVDVEVAGMLGETGHQLLLTWAEEQGLRGFCGTEQGPGRRWRAHIQSAITHGLTRAATDRSATWPGWRHFFGRHLRHAEIPPREAAIIREALCLDSNGHRRELINFIVSVQGRNLLDSSATERAFHDALRAAAGKRLRHLLEAIGTYERFARLLTDGFYDCRHLMTSASRPLSPTNLATAGGVRRGGAETSDLYVELHERLEPYDLAADLSKRFGRFADRLPADEWVDALLIHHHETQHGKPPNGKAPWCERFDDGRYMLRPRYRVDDPSKGDSEYVHQYRTQPLASFAQDLGMVK